MQIKMMTTSFNIEGMRNANFNFPISKPGLLAAKAAGLLVEAMYWDVFDRVQYKLFVENKNIEDISFRRSCKRNKRPFED